MDALKAAFESQFGTEWSTPIVKPSDTTEPINNEGSGSECEGSSGSEDETETKPEGESDGPITVKHNELGISTSQPVVSKSQRRKFMSSGVPGDDTDFLRGNTDTNGKDEDLKNDLALQRLIEESHLLHENQQFSGADISGAADPLDNIGKTRIKVMDARLAKAGAKKKSSIIPQTMSVGIREKAKMRKSKIKEEARNAGIILAKDRFTKSKNRSRDKGLKINSIGKASEFGISISPAEIARISGQNKKSRKRK